MVIPLVMLVILAFVVIRSLMVVVDREKARPTVPGLGEPTIGMSPPRLRARADDGVRGLLLPAAADTELIDDTAVSNDLLSDARDG